jgi:hypothetical protein
MFTYDGNPLNAIDFYICDVDFGVNLESHFKNKLDNLNDFYKTHDGHINVFPKITKTPSELPCYIGGYPVQNRAT